MISIETLSNLAAVFGVCIGAVNVIVEVLKACWLKKEVKMPYAVLITSEVIAFFAAYAYCVIENVSMNFTMISGVAAGGFFIAYGAMFGYDKLYGEVLESIENIFKGNKND